MRCRVRPDERQNCCNEDSQTASAGVAVCPENGEIVESLSPKAAIGMANGQKGPRNWLRTGQDR